ncbi:MAG TPA: InlB B-repeat-containing protein [Oscillospiraceae bacterium]|nr:InlB B-repeat-containing protein [Oscillospiraceae bacterium]
MKRKLSKLGRSTVSVLLCLGMLLTTFCFFDIGSVISEALVSKSDHALTEAGSDSSTFAKYNILMPELVYIKAGGRDSEYFLNATSSGTVSEPTSETGVFSFSCATARSVTISITVLDASLNASSANRVTNVAFTDGSDMSSEKSLSASSSTVTKTIKSLSMANFEENKQYIIRWNIVYTTASGSYTTYAYTGIKFPLLAQAGMTTRQYYYGTYGGINGNPAESTTYSFITGVDAVKGGNVGSKWVSTGSTLTAPLINFNASLYPRGLDMPIDNNYFNPDGSGVLLAFAKYKTNGIYFGEGSRIYNTPWDSSQSYNPMNLITDDKVSKGYFGGKPGTDGDSYGYAAADIMIDTSRYSNFKQVPNLRAGFVEFDSDGGANQNYLNAIRNVSYTSSDAAKYFRKNRTINNNAGSMNTAPTIYCPDVDRSDEKNDRSWVRGLYKLDGNITTAKNNLKKTTSGGTELQIASFSNNVYSTYIRFEYSLRFNPFVGFDEYCSGISTVRLNATLTSKATARKYYSRFLNSGVNTSASNWSTIEGYVKSYVKTLCVPTAAAGSYTNPASAISTAQTNLKGSMKTTTPLSAPLYFYVPETIYLAPNIDSSHTRSSANFQWFIQNTVNTATAGAATTKQSYDTNGYVYFSYANLDTTQNVSLSATALNASGSVISGGSIKSLTFSDDGVYKKATITQESTSPSLTVATTGYYIRWTVKYTDAVDGYEKQAVAYTYVYKPYIQPSGTAMDSRNEAGDNHDAGNITWVSGVHSDAAGGDRYPNSVSGGNRSMVPFSSTAKSSKPLGVKGTQLYAQFPDWFGTSASNNSPNDWFNTSSSTYLPRKTFVYLKYFEGNGGFWGGTNPNSNHTWLTAPTTYLYVDTSRYSNLKYIPNLSAGLFVTSDKSSDKGAWYVADATDKEETVSQTENQRDKNNFGSARTLYYNYKKIIANEGSFDSPGDYEAEGVKYNGPVDIELMKAAGSEKVYKVKATYFNSQSTDKITNAGVMPIKVYQNDKGDLRKAVMRAQNNFPNLGITYNGSSFNSYFYSGTEFTTFCTNYERAYKELVKLDGRFYSSKTIAAIANELNSAIDNLIAGKSLKTNCTAREYNLGLEKLGNGNYKIIEIDGGEQYEITYDARDNVYFTPDTYEGYTYVGKCALTNESIVPSDYYGKTLASLPAFFTSSNTTRQKMELQGGVPVFTDGAETITVPRFDGDTTAYEWVAAVNDTSLTMVNFYFIDQNKIYFDPNDGSSGVNLLTQPTTYKSGNNFYSPTFTSSPGNGVTATFDQTDSTFTFNGTPTTGAEYFRFPIAGKLKANTNYTYRVVYVSGSKTLDGGTLTLTLDICDKNGNRCYKASGENYSDRFVFDQTANQATTSRTLAPDAYQAANAEFVQVFTYSPSYGTVKYNNYKVKIELVESGSANQTYSPNAIQQFYGRSIGTMPVPVRDNYRFLGWFTAPDGGDRVTASSVMGSSDMTVYAHWALTEKALLLDNEFDFDSFVSKASNNNSFDILMNSYKACKGQAMTNPLSDQTKPYTYSIAKDVEGDTALNVKYDRSSINGNGEVFDSFKSNTYTASKTGEYTLSYEYRINDYYSQFNEEHGNSGYDSVVLGFSTNDGYWYNGGVNTGYTENKKPSNGYESVELRRSFTAGTQYFFNMIFYFCNEDGANRFRADLDLKNVVLKDPDGNIVLSSNGMNTVSGTSSFDSDARAITLKPTGTDCYTNTYDNLSSYRSTLEAGKKYTLLMDYQATTAMQIAPFIFFYPNATSTSYTSHESAYIQVPAGSGTVAMQFTVPANNYYQIRFSENSVDGSTVPGTLTLGNISLQRTEIFSDGAYVADSSTYLGWVSKVTGSASATAVYVNDLSSRNEKLTAHYQDLEHGSQITDVYVPTREGFTFLGWWNAAGTQITDANGNAVGNAAITATTKLYSRWMSKTFSLKYNAFRPNDSAGAVTDGIVADLPSPNPQTLKFGVASSISSTVPTLTGYTFSGWSKTSGGTKAYDKGQALSASTVSQMYKDCGGETYNIYTVWTPHKFYVKFNGNGNTNTTANMTNQQFTYDVYQKLSANKYVNSRTLTYNKNDSAAAPATIDRNSDTRGLTFKGWTASAEGVATTEPTVKYIDGQNIKNPNGYSTDGGTTNLYAKWQGVAVTLPTTTRSGYIFAGWYDAATGGNKIGDAGANYTITADKTIYAHWTTREYTITYIPNGGSVTPTSDTFTIESAIDLPTPKREGYVFDGWMVTKAEGSWVKDTLYTGAKIDAGNYGNVTVTAQWSKIINVYFYSGENKATVYTIPLTFKNGETTKQITAFGKGVDISGWKQEGWTTSTDANADVVKAKIVGGTSLNVDVNNGPFAYYAIYTQTQTLKYNSNATEDKTVKNIPSPTNGTAYYNSFTSLDKATNVTHDIPSTVPTRSGYTFASWNTEPNGSGESHAAGGRFTNKNQTDTLYAIWKENKYTITYSYNGSGTADKSINYTITSAITIENAPTYKDHVFVGWKVTEVAAETSWTSGTLYVAGAKVGTGNFGNVKLVAQWVDISKAQENYGNEDYVDATIDVVIGVDKDNKQIVTTVQKFDNSNGQYTEYVNAKNAYDETMNALKKLQEAAVSKTGEDLIAYGEQIKETQKSFQAAVDALAGITLKERTVISDYLNNFRIDNTTTEHNLSEMNLNHYSKDVLNEVLNTLTAGANLNKEGRKITEKVNGKSYQTIMNEYVAKIADLFKNQKSTVKESKPAFEVYESVASINNSNDASLKAMAGVTAVNYVHTKKGATYYCYVNTKNPVILVTVNDIAGNSRVCYPTKAKVLKAEKSLESKEGVTASYSMANIHVTGDTSYDNYINNKIELNNKNASIGSNLSYYQQKQVIKLTPEFVGNSNGTVTYEFAATDDALKANVANQAKLSGDTSYSSTARYSLIDPKKPDTVDNRKYTTNENTIKIVVDYHVAEEIKDKNGNVTDYKKLDVTGDQVENDKWLNQYHLFRQSGGASNWELPKTGDKAYTVNDKSYGQTDRGSFTFTYELGALDIANGKLNTTDVNEIIALFKNSANYDNAVSCKFQGTKYQEVASNGQKIIRTDGKGVGYLPWGNNWSFNYYPKSQSYTYVHLVDRWGNVADKVFYVGNQDIKAVSVATASTDGSYTILEDGGSGIATLSLNAANVEILTNENSTIENNVYKTTGNVIRIKTGEANKSYTLSMKDKATNASTAALKSDENGIITLNVEDTAYKSGVYTFTLNGMEINLYDNVENDKYIVKVYDGEAEEGEAAELRVVTTGEVGKVRFTDTDGNTITVAASEKNDDGTKTWSMTKSKPAGEYEYSISVKVGYEWITENSKVKLTFTEKILDSGLIRSAEYDAESGLYKITIEGRATKIQFISEDGMTRTYTRYHDSVKSRKTYDEDGNEVNDTARTLDHEIWLVDAKIYSGQKYTVMGKFEAGWNREGTASLTAH